MRGSGAGCCVGGGYGGCIIYKRASKEIKIAVLATTRARRIAEESEHRS